MQFKVKKISEIKAEITITNTSAEVKEAFEFAYKKAQTKVKVPGFRVGKAPIDLIKTHITEDIVNEAANYLLKYNMKECIEKLDPPAYDYPQLELLEFNEKKGAEWKGKYELPASVKLGNYKKFELEEDQVEIDDVYVDEALENMRLEKAVLVPREGSTQKDDYVEVKLKLSEVKKNEENQDTYTELFQRDSISIALHQNQLLPGADEQMLGMQLDEERRFTLSVPSDFKEEIFAGKEIYFEVKLLGAKYRELPVLDDDFAKSMGDYNGLLDLRKFIVDINQAHIRHTIEERSKTKILEKIVSSSQINIPDKMLELQYNAKEKEFEENLRRFSKKSKMSIEEFAKLTKKDLKELKEELKGKALSDIKNQLVINKLLEEISVDVNETEIDKYIDDISEKEISIENKNKYKKNDKIRENVRNKIKENKMLHKLYEGSKITKNPKLNLKSWEEKMNKENQTQEVV